MVTSIFNQQTQTEEQIFGLRNTPEPSKAGVQTLQNLLKTYTSHPSFHSLLLLAWLTQAGITAPPVCPVATRLLTGVATGQHHPWPPKTRGKQKLNTGIRGFRPVTGQTQASLVFYFYQITSHLYSQMGNVPFPLLDYICWVHFWTYTWYFGMKASDFINHSTSLVSSFCSRSPYW